MTASGETPSVEELRRYDEARKLWRFVELHGVRHVEAPEPCSLVDFFDAADALREALVRLSDRPAE